MPANLTPQYRSAEEEFRQATETADKIRCLQEMIRLLPKHKGTDHLYGDLKRKLAELRSEEHKKGGHRTPTYYVDREGAGQVVVLGAPNTGKSQILARLTRAHVEVGEYPFTTRTTVPGMMFYKDIQIQLIDTPPASAQYMEPWLPDIVRRADAAVVLVDLGSDVCLEQAEGVLDRLEEAKIHLRRELPPESGRDPRQAYRRAMLVGNKLDLPGAPDRLQLLTELYDERFDVHGISALHGLHLEDFRQWVFEFLRLVRIYTRAPGKKEDLGAPFALPLGSTVHDLAGFIHKDLAHTVRQARVWGQGVYEGQYVKLDHVLHEGDIVELHG